MTADEANGGNAPGGPSILDLLTALARQLNGSDPVPERLVIQALDGGEVTVRLYRRGEQEFEGYYFILEQA